MVQVDVACTAVRLTPVWLCLAAHCSDGHWPTPLQATLRVFNYGFSVESFRRRPLVLFTHLFVHANDAHLYGNLTSLTAALMEFGGSSVLENVEEEDMKSAISRTIGSLFVFIIGGIIGGLGGQLLFNDAQRMRRHPRRWFTLPGMPSNILNNSNNNNSSNYGGLQFSQEDKLLGVFTSLTQRVRDWVDNITYHIEKKRADNIFMCGASAGICALSGFNAAYYERWNSAFAIVVPELIAVLYSLLLVEENPTSKLSGTIWLPAGEVVGHAAHVGGFIIGIGLGMLWRCCKGKCNKNDKERQGVWGK